MKKLLIISAILISNVVLLLILDCLFFCFIDGKRENFDFQTSFNRYKQFQNIVYFDKVYKEKEDNNYFRDFVKNNSKSPILIFGCSFGYGYLLEAEQSFSYKLSEYTERSIYNRSISSLGIQYFPYIMEHYNVEKDVKNPEYIIFVMIDNHLYRLYREIMDVSEPYVDILYKQKKTTLEEKKLPYSILFKSAIIRYINVQFVKYIYEKRNHDKIFDFMKAHFIKAKEIAKTKFPNSKIVILQYEENPDSWIFYNPRWKEMTDEGFIVINSYDLTKEHLYEKQYRIENDVHPNEKAWDLLVPKLVERLKL